MRIIVPVHCASGIRLANGGVRLLRTAMEVTSSGSVGGRFFRDHWSSRSEVTRHIVSDENYRLIVTLADKLLALLPITKASQFRRQLIIYMQLVYWANGAGGSYSTTDDNALTKLKKRLDNAYVKYPKIRNLLLPGRWIFAANSDSAAWLCDLEAIIPAKTTCQL